jgi:DNA-binding transcriptional MerR regulator
VGALAGVTGNTIGQWARWGYIRASRSTGDPHVYSVEDAAEAALVHELLERGVSHAQVRRAIGQLPGRWPLTDAALATTAEARPRIVLDGAFVLSPRGWQRVTEAPPLRELHLRLRHTG